MCAAVGVPHPVISEAIVAFVETQAGSAVQVSQLERHARGLAAYMRPHHYVLLDAGQMPLNRVAKADYLVLRERAMQEMEALREQGRWIRRPNNCPRLTLTASTSERQSEGEYGASARLGGQGDGSAVRFHNCLRDGESHSRALHALALAASAIKLVKDHALIDGVDPRALVRHAGDQHVSLHLGGDCDGRAARANTWRRYRAVERGSPRCAAGPSSPGAIGRSHSTSLRAVRE